MNEERVKTGIPGLDSLIQGGLNRGSINLVTGDSGCGKTTFAMQFLYYGTVKYREPGIFISFEEPKKLVYKNMLKFGWNLEELEAQKKLAFIEYPTQEVAHFMAQEVLLRSSIEEMGVKRVAIDSITPFALLYETELKRRQEIHKLLAKLRKWGCTIMLTSECDIDRFGEPTARFNIEALADGLVYLYNQRKEKQRKKALEVVKMRGSEIKPNLYPIKFTKHGIAVQSGSSL